MALAPLLMLAAAAALAGAAPDWTDCQAPCVCKWSSGKKTAQCRNAGFTRVPDSLDSDMQVLNLSGNSIARLGRDAFKSVGLLNLQRVYMRSCQVRELHRDAFRDLIILVEVDLTDNRIAALQPDTFYGNERLRVLCLSGNPLVRLGRAQFPKLPHLRTLELEACRLESVHRDAFIHLTALESLDLRSNRLRELSEAVFMGFAHLKSLALDGNPWRCDCELRGFRDWFLASKLRSVPLVCREPRRLEDLPWEDVPPEDFACPPQVTLVPYPIVQAEAGGNVSFGCRVKGDPEPEVTWLYDDRPINHTWLVLEAEEGLLDKWANISVSNVSDADAGVYTCTAKNSLSAVSKNVSLVLPEVVTATTLSKSESRLLWWMAVSAGGLSVLGVLCVVATVCCLRNRTQRRRRRNRLKASVSFTDQEKKLLDVSIATTTDRGTGSCEALAPDLDSLGAAGVLGPADLHQLQQQHHHHHQQSQSQQPPVHITIESEPLPLAVFPPPPEFSTSVLPAGAYGNILISVSVSRDPASLDAASRCPDLLDLPHRIKPPPTYHGMATLPRRPRAIPQYDNMGPRVTAGGSSTLSLPGSAAPLPPGSSSSPAPISATTPELPPSTPPPPPPPATCAPPPSLMSTPEFVSL